jgi:hypothetical protein
MCVCVCVYSHQPQGYALFVFDSDVVGNLSDVPLTRWFTGDEDLLFYERSWNYEIMAGNYMVRNTGKDHELSVDSVRNREVSSFTHLTPYYSTSHSQSLEDAS